MEKRRRGLAKARCVRRAMLRGMSKTAARRKCRIKEKR